MLAEYALIPDIFDSNNYVCPEVCDVWLQSLKQPLLEEGLVRDLCDGDWGEYVKGETLVLHPRAKELFRKIVTQNRLRLFPSVKIKAPKSNSEWREESLASHELEPLTGIVTTNVTIEAADKKNPIIAPIQTLFNTPWWQSRSPSVRLRRTTDDYSQHLRKVLCHADSIMFIDPHLDPTKRNYREFIELLRLIRRASPPLIEIHRVSSTNDSLKNKGYPTKQRWKERFDGLHRSLKDMDLSIEVFIWNDMDASKFHDRYLITDIIGISLPNGFDVGRGETIWTRLGRKDRDDIQREFDPASQRRRLTHRFCVGMSLRQ